VRPIVIPDNTIVSFEVESRSDEIICALDSRRETVDKNVQLAVRKESFVLNLVRLNENNFCKPSQQAILGAGQTQLILSFKVAAITLSDAV
jgi:NAD kinase